MARGMQFSTVRYEEAEGVATVTLDRPDRHNAFDSVMVRELQSIWDSLRANDEVRAVVLTGAGEKAFCTGIDRSEIPADESAFTFDPFTYEDPGQFLGPKARGLWKPVVAAVNGIACGGAFYLLGEADVIVAAREATFFDPHVTYGMPAIFESALMLARLPFGVAAKMALLGVDEKLTADRAREVGLVTDVVPAEELAAVAGRLARSIASRPPRAVQATLRALWAARELTPRQLSDLGNVLLALGASPESLQWGHEQFGARRSNDSERDEPR